MIIRENVIEVGDFLKSDALLIEGNRDLYKDALFFDLEHYVFKKPICIGVVGCSYYDENDNCLKVTQYMIESNEDSKVILGMAKDYFKEKKEKLNKNNIVTFSGNNDFTVINYLFNRHNIDYDIDSNFYKIDLQKQYEKDKKSVIGLKALEKEFGIERKSELISGSNLAKTFRKIVRDKKYYERMPESKKEKILLYNEQDVVSLFFMYVNWNKIFPDFNS